MEKTWPTQWPLQIICCVQLCTFSIYCLNSHTGLSSLTYRPFFTHIQAFLHSHTGLSSLTYRPFFTHIQAFLHSHTGLSSLTYRPFFTHIQAFLLSHTGLSSLTYRPFFTLYFLDEDWCRFINPKNLHDFKYKFTYQRIESEQLVFWILSGIWSYLT